MNSSEKIKSLIKKGVTIPNPSHIEIGEEVDIDRISGKDVTIYSGCKLFGASTFIHQGVKIGYEGPATIENCQIATNVELNSGFFRNAIFLNNVKIGSGAHIREGTILEEEARVAHTVGLKQTILFPFVTLGSLINFCDCLMSGGTSRKDHSEVGSAYVHFNYTPDQHKATASLIGDVSRGVMLRQKPIFLGGQGGLVGPCRLEFGTIVAAGTICRKDELRPNRFIFGGAKKEGNITYKSGIIQREYRIIRNNIEYIANLFALMQWYKNIRSQFISDHFTNELLIGLQKKLAMGINERVNKLEEYYLCQNWTEIKNKWDEFNNSLAEYELFIGDRKIFHTFFQILSDQIQKSENDYICVIKSLNETDANIGTMWLNSIVDHITSGSAKILLDKDYKIK